MREEQLPEEVGLESSIFGNEDSGFEIGGSEEDELADIDQSFLVYLENEMDCLLYTSPSPRD